MKIDNPWYYYSNGRLIKKRKPCLTNDYVHINGMNGMYQVKSTSITFFTITKNREERQITWDKFQCLKGQGTSEDTIIKRKLKHLINTINISINNQLTLNTLLSNELANIRQIRN